MSPEPGHGPTLQRISSIEGCRPSVTEDAERTGIGGRGDGGSRTVGRARWVAHGGSRVSREAPRHPAGERWCQRHANRSPHDVIRSSLSSREDRRSSHGAGRRGTPPCIVGRASCARLPGILPGSDGVNGAGIVPLATRRVRVSILGRVVVACTEQGGAGRHPASGEDAQPTYATLHRARTPNPQKWVAHGGSRILREAPRHPAGERWCKRRRNRSSRDAASSCLSSREDRRRLHGTGRRGTPPCIGRGRPTHIRHPASGEDAQPTGDSYRVSSFTVTSSARATRVSPITFGPPNTNRS